jgi:hypothetical protein
LLFDKAKLVSDFMALGHPKITIFGEAYGGKQQGQSYRYGKTLKFVAFDVRIGDTWFSVPQAHEVVTALGLEFVHYHRIRTIIKS